MINSRKLVSRLVDVGFETSQAEALVDVILSSRKDQLATKEGIANVRTDIASLEAKTLKQSLFGGFGLALLIIILKYFG